MDDKLKEIASYFRVDSESCRDCQSALEDDWAECIECLKREIDKNGLAVFKECLINNLCCRPHLDFCEADCFHNCRECWEKWWGE